MKKILFGLSMAFALTVTTADRADAQRVVKETYKVRHPWSHKKKDAVIGTGVGAVTGAIVGHGAKGAVIGGVVGGGAGYLLGRHKDRKTGYVPRREVVYKRKYHR